MSPAVYKTHNREAESVLRHRASTQERSLIRYDDNYLAYNQTYPALAFLSVDS